jgi:hypothetical protein
MGGFRALRRRPDMWKFRLRAPIGCGTLRLATLSGSCRETNMPKFLFADEAGCFTFKRKQGASKYFMLCTLCTDDCSLSHELLHLRRELIADGEIDRDKLHATADAQSTRDAVFSVLAKHRFRIDATLLEKSKAQPQTRTSEPRFYQYAWFYHFRHVGPQLIDPNTKLLITAAALGQKKTKASFKLALNNTIQQIIARSKWEVSFMDSSKDPMLWAADYCAWAIQRRWESNGQDDRSYKIIKPKISTEYDLWATGNTHYY